MPRLILSTSNIIGTGTSVLRRPNQTSNVEFVAAIRANLQAARQRSGVHPAQTNGDGKSWRRWTSEEGDVVYIPGRQPQKRGLAEERASYEVTVKLFLLANTPPPRRCAQTREAIQLVLEELQIPYIDLLIVSFPGIAFDAEDEDGAEHVHERVEDIDDCGTGEAHVEDVDTMIESWECLEQQYEAGVIKKLGLSEFGEARLAKFLEKTKIRPGVDQINVRDCCVVPRGLITYAKREKVELLTHNDCTNILPRGSLRDMLGHGDGGFGILAGGQDDESKEDGIRGNVEPQWVIKYTAVVRDRGVIENKGYFAMAETSPSSYSIDAR